jgi:hypothetical protein
MGRSHRSATTGASTKDSDVRASPHQDLSTQCRPEESECGIADFAVDCGAVDTRRVDALLWDFIAARLVALVEEDEMTRVLDDV